MKSCSCSCWALRRSLRSFLFPEGKLNSCRQSSFHSVKTSSETAGCRRMRGSCQSEPDKRKRPATGRWSDGCSRLGAGLYLKAASSSFELVNTTSCSSPGPTQMWSSALPELCVGPQGFVRNTPCSANIPTKGLSRQSKLLKSPQMTLCDETIRLIFSKELLSCDCCALQSAADKWTFATQTSRPQGSTRPVRSIRERDSDQAEQNRSFRKKVAFTTL
mmetsp:Transcript_50805/g.95017  ORF Transcript_50805/g.95017 Transcript_50805/m.95017 type:complete len:218 (+) Transcript_50805:301-954(+)